MVNIGDNFSKKMNSCQHTPIMKKRNPFEEFDQMIKEKYGIADEMYAHMSYKERNRRLREMLEKETILIFPNKGLSQIDGMPNFGIIYSDLRNMA